MKQNKIIPIRQCSCCYENIDIEKEIDNQKNIKKENSNKENE